MWRLYLLLVLVWLVLMPPLFTAGQCTVEFEAESARLQADMARVRQADSALAYWQGRGVPVTTLSADDCRRVRPRYLDRCGLGLLVYAKVPVQDPVCRIYRDSEIRIQLQYDELGRLARMATDMNPFRSLPIPFTGVSLHWAR